MLMQTTQFEQALEKQQARQTISTLGDRSQYVGSSDLHCVRRSVLNKIKPVKHDLRTLIRFRRGAMVEDLVAEVLQDFQPQRQATFYEFIPYCPVCEYIDIEANLLTCPRCQEKMKLLPLQAHLDFLLPGNRVVEVKASSLLEIMPSYETQLQFQLYMLHQATGKHAEGAILVLDIGSAKMKMGNGYAYDPSQTHKLLTKAARIWEGLEEAKQAEHPEALGLSTEPSPLCGFCGFLATCPAFAGEELPQEFQAILKQYNAANLAEKEAKETKEALKNNLLQILKPGKYQAGSYRVSISKRSRTTTDLKQLEVLLGELGQDISQYQKSSKYAVLDVKAA